MLNQCIAASHGCTFATLVVPVLGAAAFLPAFLEIAYANGQGHLHESDLYGYCAP
jgi:hypothetical protein